MFKLPENIDSKFRYVLISAARAEQLSQGALPKLEGERKKDSRTAMLELGQGLVNWDYGPAPEPEPDEEAPAAEIEA